MAEATQLEVDNADLVSALVAVGILVWYVATKSWYANNVLGLCFSVQGVAMINIGSYQIGAILLVCASSSHSSSLCPPSRCV